jgi:hypothetical protein
VAGLVSPTVAPSPPGRRSCVGSGGCAHRWWTWRSSAVLVHRAAPANLAAVFALTGTLRFSQ